MLQKSTIQFLQDLKRNNNKPWFDANRKVYEAAKKDFLKFIQQVIDRLGKKDQSIQNILAKETIFRINRDIRFSKDKSPYKTNFGASINKDGRKAMGTAGYYFHLEPDSSFVGGGIYMPMPENLKKIRQEIDYNFKDFKKLLRATKFNNIYGDLSRDESYLLKRIPKGYEADHPAADYLRLKSFVALHSIKKTELTNKNLVQQTVDAFVALRPLIDFLNTGLD